MSIIRAFIAISLPPRIRELVVEVQERFHECGKTLSWIKPENVHLTVRFLGNISEEKVPAIGEAIKKGIADTHPFRMEIDEIGVFPNLKYPRVIWLGVEEATHTLIDLENRISDEMETLGFEREERKFTPHITLGWVKTYKKKNKIIEIIQSQGKIYGAEIAMESVELYRSDLKPTGAVHTVLSRFSLKKR